MAAALCIVSAVLAFAVRGRAIPVLLVAAGGLLEGAGNWWSFEQPGSGALVSSIAGIVAFVAAVVAAAAWPGVPAREAGGGLTVLRLVGAALAALGTAGIAAGISIDPSSWGEGRVLTSTLLVLVPCGLFAVATAALRARLVAYVLVAAGGAATGYFVASVFEIGAQPIIEVRGKDVLMAASSVVVLIGGVFAAAGLPRPWPRKRPTA